MGRCVYPSGVAEAKVILPESVIRSAASILITWSITQQFLLDGPTCRVLCCDLFLLSFVFCIYFRSC